LWKQGIFKKQKYGNVQDLKREENFEEILENQLNLVFVRELSPAAKRKEQVLSVAPFVIQKSLSRETFLF
jgi:hypothetical protein